MKKRKRLFISWVVAMGLALALFFMYHDSFSPEQLKQLFSASLFVSVPLYFLVTIVRVFALIPLTPFLLAGMLVIDPRILFIVSLLSVLLASAMMYSRGKYLGLEKYFQRNYPQQIQKMRIALSQRELPFIILRAFLPFTPTDLICYICEIMKVKLRKVLVGVGIGEGIIIALYIFGTDALRQRIMM